MSKKLDVLANLAIITLVVLIVVTMFDKRSHQAQANDDENSVLAQGKYLQPPAGYRWEQHSRTLLMALRYGCVHCERNMQLYRELHNKYGKGGVETELLSIFPDDAVVAQHDIDSHGLHGLPFLANVDFKQLRLPGTPTLLLVDNHGAILHSWIGELSQDRQAEVMQLIQ